MNEGQIKDTFRQIIVDMNELADAGLKVSIHLIALGERYKKLQKEHDDLKEFVYQKILPIVNETRGE